jgi:nitroimidazol reductase NimA-like FMN-containing flavoprotein (pyridoxamine 5'-phosphate oxidase superfamily)
MERRELEVIDEVECRHLLGTEHVGRLVFLDHDGPAALPVIYSLAGDEIVFRSQPGSKVNALHGQDIGFEVDVIDAESHSGWSVLARGSSREVPLDDLPELLARFHGDVPLPWKKGVHAIWVAITPRVLTGRRLEGPLIDEDA